MGKLSNNFTKISPDDFEESSKHNSMDENLEHQNKSWDCEN